MTLLSDERLDLMEPISLAELVERAELLTRVDRKYVLRTADADGLLAAVDAQARVLEIDGRREFGYRSTYFDTPGRDSFLGSGRSHRRRWKVRTRAYLDTGSCWLEVKTRQGRDQTRKQRIEHPDLGRADRRRPGLRRRDHRPRAGRGAGAGPGHRVPADHPVPAGLGQPGHRRRRPRLDLPDPRRRPGPARPGDRRDEDRVHAVRGRPVAVGPRAPSGAALEVRGRDGRAPPGAAPAQVAPRPATSTSAFPEPPEQERSR